MARIETTVSSLILQPENVAETAPVRDLSEVLDSIRVDAASNAPQFLKETEVPYGGE